MSSPPDDGVDRTGAPGSDGSPDRPDEAPGSDDSPDGPDGAPGGVEAADDPERTPCSDGGADGSPGKSGPSDGWRSAAEGLPDEGPPADDYEVLLLWDGSAGEERSYTLAPREAGELERTVRWITARAGSTVSLDEVR